MASNGHFWALDIGSYHRSYCRFTSSGATNNTSSIVTTTFRILEHNAPRMHSLQPEKKWSVCLGFQLKHRGAVEIHTRQKKQDKKPQPGCCTRAHRRRVSELRVLGRELVKLKARQDAHQCGIISHVPHQNPHQVLE